MILNGHQIAENIIGEIQLRQKKSKRIAFFLFKDDIASRSFIKRKIKTADLLNIDWVIFEEFGLSQSEALSFIKEKGQEFDGLVVQLPLPANFEPTAILDAVPVEKDLDVLSQQSLSEFKSGKNRMSPPVAAAVKEIFERFDIRVPNMSIVVLGKGRLVGAPVAALFRKLNIPFHNFDINDSEPTISSALKTADIIISGIGVPKYIRPEMVKDGVILIDAGTSESSGKIVGDIDPACDSKAKLMTPVPGGVGPITVAALFKNLFV